MGVRVPAPWASPARQSRYGPLHRDPAADSDGEDDSDDPAARRRILELSSFGNDRSGPKSRRQKGNAMASISAEEQTEAVTSSGAGRGSFPMTSFTSSQGAGDQQYAQTSADGAADQLQKELELFAQDDDEEGALIRTDYPDEYDSRQNWADPQNDGAQGQDDAEIQEFEQFFDQNQ